MTIRIILRAAFAFFCFLTSLYALLAYVPFTYQQVHKGGLIPALNSFGQFHHYLYWLALLMAAVFFCLDPLPPQSRRWAMRIRAAFWYIHVPLGVFFALRPAFAAMENNVTSYVWSLVMLEPILYISIVVIYERWPQLPWSQDRRGNLDTRRLFFAAIAAGIFLSAVYNILGAFRGHANWSFLQGAFTTASSLVTHLVIFLAFAVLLHLLGIISAWSPFPRQFYFVSCHLVGAVILSALFETLAFPSLSFNGPAANAYGITAGVTITTFLFSLCLLLAPLGPNEKIESGFALAFWIPQAHSLITRTWLRSSITAAVIAAAAVGLAIATSKNDWNYLFQKLTACIVWVAAFRCCYLINWKFPRMSRSTGRLLLLALLALPLYRIVNAAERSLWSKTGSKQTLARFLDAYSGFDASYKILRDSLAVSGAVPGFYQFLARNTNLPNAVQIKPAEVQLAPAAATPGTFQPHIFFFVIDSLRRDYLSPYNDRVDFTPNLAQFAQESTVLKNSFTRYGGTGLSEPSIWVGGAMIHKQYVTPFAPMNSLQKLLESHHYQSFVSRDSILRTVVADSPNLHDLADNVDTMSLDFCSTVTELESKLDAASKGPVFAYTQPQNIHISVINREGGKPIDGNNYHGFYAPYASRLRRIDGCFGNFIAELKKRGLYDSSIVIFTADHGDSLGEEGRWGHAYTLFPEIIKVPLIVHLPPSLRAKNEANTTMLAFNSDVTPSLYYLLGHRPLVKSELFGRPLFTEHPQEQNYYKRENYLVSSSYAAVYGILSGDGTFLFTADAVNLKDSWFDLTETTPAARYVPSSMRSAQEALIRDKITAVSTFYKFKPIEPDH